MLLRGFHLSVTDNAFRSEEQVVTVLTTFDFLRRKYVREISSWYSINSHKIWGSGICLVWTIFPTTDDYDLSHYRASVDHNKYNDFVPIIDGLSSKPNAFHVLHNHELWVPWPDTATIFDCTSLLHDWSWIWPWVKEKTSWLRLLSWAHHTRCFA